MATTSLNNKNQQARQSVSLNRVTKFFGPQCVVNHISFNVNVGEVLGVMGPNGAGKTTTMRMISGFLRPSSGVIKLNGIDVSNNPLAAKKLLGYLPEGAPLWPDMSALYLLRFAARVRKFSASEASRLIDKAMELADLKNVATQPIATLSKGFRRRVGLAQAIFHDPPILVLDEPTDGLDPNQKRHVRSLIRSMAETKAIIISTHILEEVEPLCTRVLIMNKGDILADESPSAFAARSKYYNAVSVRVSRVGYKRLIESCQHLQAIRAHEVSVKMNEAQIVFFPAANYEGEKIAQEVRQQADKQKMALHSLEVEGGRLEDVFYNMTGDKTV